MPYTKPQRIPYLKERDDLRYLPYLYLMFNQTYLPNSISREYSYAVDDMCNDKTPTFSDGDTVLYKIGRQSINRVDYVRKYIAGAGPKAAKYIYPDEISVRKSKQKTVKVGEETFNIDSLRVRVIAYNDRNALKMLEKYFTFMKKKKELAIYYKVMLSYEGNGDLAEKYYNVLKPYLPKHPEFLNGIREVLLRAAICDGNARAQALCDSLGFSLYDYRLPIPDGTY